MMQKSGSTFLARLTQNTTRQMSTAGSIQARFE